MIQCKFFRKVICLDNRMLDRPNIKMDLQDIGCTGVGKTKLAQYRLLTESSGVIHGREFLSLSSGSQSTLHNL
jgi:hypothetical protein